MAAFDTPEADLGKENDLDDVEAILGMPTEEVSIVSQEKR